MAAARTLSWSLCLHVAALGLAAASCSGDIGDFASPATDDSASRPPPPGQDPPPPPPDKTTPVRPGDGLLPARVVRLNARQYANTVATILREPVDASITRTLAELAGGEGNVFSNDAQVLDLSGPYTRALSDLAERLSARAWMGRKKIDGCLETTPLADACIDRSLRELARRAFRRASTADEAARFRAFYNARAAADGPELAFRLTFEAIIAAPQTLFRTELGEPAGEFRRLTGPEIASALSYWLTDGPPDDELLASAEQGALKTDTGVRAQAARLLQSATGAAGVMRLFTELWGLDTLATIAKDRTVYPAWSPQIATALHGEALDLVRHVLWEGDGRFATLLTAPFTVGDGKLAAYYGLPGVDPAAPKTKLTLPPERAGFLTSAGVLSAHARDNESDIVRRGVFVRERLLCLHPPPPPPEVNAVPPKPDAKRTQREALAAHAGPACAACHQLIDPLGFPFEVFDGIGRHRGTQAGKPIDTSGALVGTSRDGTFGTAVELARQLATHPQVESCMVEWVRQYALGTAARAEDESQVKALTERFRASGGQLRDLLLDVATSNAFLLRK